MDAHGVLISIGDIKNGIMLADHVLAASSLPEVESALLNRNAECFRPVDVAATKRNVHPVLHTKALRARELIQSPLQWPLCC